MWIPECLDMNIPTERIRSATPGRARVKFVQGLGMQDNKMCLSHGNGVYSSLFRAKASGGHSKARETRDAQFLQKFTWFALIAVTSARPRVCKCPPPRIPVSQSPF